MQSSQQISETQLKFIDWVLSWDCNHWYEWLNQALTVRAAYQNHAIPVDSASLHTKSFDSMCAWEYDEEKFTNIRTQRSTKHNTTNSKQSRVRRKPQGTIERSHWGGMSYLDLMDFETDRKRIWINSVERSPNKMACLRATRKPALVHISMDDKCNSWIRNNVSSYVASRN